MVEATTRPVLAPGQMSQLSHRLAPIAGMISVTALLAVSVLELLKPHPQIRSCAQVAGDYGSSTQLRCVEGQQETVKVLGPSMAPRGSIDGYLTPSAEASERLEP